MDYVSIKALMVNLEETDRELRATGYHVKRQVHSIKESIQTIKECVHRIQSAAKDYVQANEPNIRRVA